jgi:glucose/arabinose dehydrogenase
VSRLLGAALVLAALAVCVTAAAAPAPVVKLATLPETLVVGQRWTASLTVTPARTPIVVARAGARSVRARARGSGGGRYSATLRFPTPGSWRLTAVVGRRSFALGRIRVLVSYPLALPAQILALDDRSLLVVERQGRDRILRVDVDTGRFSIAASRIPAPWGLAGGSTGRVLVSGGDGLYELGGRKLAEVAASPIATSPSGDVYFAEAARVGRIGRDGRVETLTTDVQAPHALVLRRDGSLVVSDSGNGRLLRIDPTTHATAVLASNLRNPLGAIETSDGVLLVLEYDTGRLLRIGNGRVLARGLRKPYALTQSASGSIYVVESGDLDRPSGAIARVAGHGTQTRLRLVPA